MLLLSVSVQLWTTGNCHWYLKQQLHFPPAKGGRAPHCGSVGLVGMLWDPISPLTLHLLTTGWYTAAVDDDVGMGDDMSTEVREMGGCREGGGDG